MDTATQQAPAAPSAPTAIPHSGPREIAAFLTEIRGIVDGVNAPRRAWVRDFGALLRDWRAGDTDVAERAGRVGAAQRVYFATARERHAKIAVPDAARSMYAVLGVWLDKQIAACDALVEVSTGRDLNHLRVAHGLYADARGEMRRFSAEFQALVQALRQKLDEMQHARKEKQQHNQHFHWPHKPG